MKDIENIELTYLTLDDYQELKAAMIDSYAKFLSAFNKTSVSWFNQKNYENP